MAKSPPGDLVRSFLDWLFGERRLLGFLREVSRGTELLQDGLPVVGVVLPTGVVVNLAALLFVPLVVPLGSRNSVFQSQFSVCQNTSVFQSFLKNAKNWYF